MFAGIPIWHVLEPLPCPLRGFCAILKWRPPLHHGGCYRSCNSQLGFTCRAMQTVPPAVWLTGLLPCPLSETV